MQLIEENNPPSAPDQIRKTMSKVITFSRVFPAYHPKAGELTHFVEKIWTSINANVAEADGLPDERERYCFEKYSPKHHTIRSGNRFKAGEYFSPRVWSGKPYNSKQIIIAPDLKIEKAWNVEVEKDSFRNDDGAITVITKIIIEGKHKTEYYEMLAQNDGLTLNDLCCWFPKPFKGQIICWNKNIEY